MINFVCSIKLMSGLALKSAYYIFDTRIFFLAMHIHPEYKICSKKKCKHLAFGNAGIILAIHYGLLSEKHIPYSAACSLINALK